MQPAGCTIGLVPPGILPFFAQMLQQQDTPTSSADEAPMMREAVLKSPLAKHDCNSQAQPSDSSDDCDSAAACGVVESRPAPPPQPAAAALPAALLQHAALPLPLPLPHAAMPGLPAALAAAVAAAAPHGYAAAPSSFVQHCYAPPPPLPAAVAPRAASGAGPEPWLAGLFTSSLFEHHGCRCHPGIIRNGAVKRNENNQYCLQCTHATGAGMCKLCLPGHAACCSGRVFQIRKYMYQTCVHVDDIQPLYDVTGVQAYCINSRRAVLIHPKNVEKEQKCPAFDHACLGCHKPLRADCTYCSLRCKVDVEYGFAPITPKGSLAPRDASAGGAYDGSLPAAAAAAAAVMLTAPPSARQSGGSRLAGSSLKRPQPFAGAAALAAASAHTHGLTLDVSHATRCSSGGEPAGSSRSKRRKGVPPERSHLN